MAVPTRTDPPGRPPVRALRHRHAVSRMLLGGLVASLAVAGTPGSGSTTTLKNRIATRTYTLPHPLEPAISNWCTWSSCALSPRLYHAPLAGTASLAGWTDATGNGHVSRLDGASIAPVVDFPGKRVRGLVAHGDGSFAVLLWDAGAERMELARRTAAGAEVWTTSLETGVAIPGSWLGDSRLAHGGGRYAAQFSVIGIIDPFIGHYAEQLSYVGDDGAVVTGGWDFGPAHSMACLVGDHPGLSVLTALSVSDCYPAKGLLADRTHVLVPADADCAGRVALQLGQMAATGGGWLVAFNALDRACCEGRGIGLVRFGADYVPTVTWLTGTDGSDERDPVLARLGGAAAANRFAVGWRLQSTETFVLAVVDSGGTFIEGPEEVSSTGVGWGNRDDAFRTRADGSVSWVRGTAGSTTLELYHLSAGSAVGVGESPAPAGFAVAQNVPNPFPGSTVIRFMLPTAARVVAAVYAVDGREVARLLDAMLAAGPHEAQWDGYDTHGAPAPAGHYVCRVRAGSWTRAVSMTLIR